MSKDAETLASWLLSDHQGRPLMIAGAVEMGLLGYGIVRLCDEDGNEWTLKARLSEGYRSAEKELANVRDAFRRELGEQA